MLPELGAKILAGLEDRPRPSTATLGLSFPTCQSLTGQPLREPWQAVRGRVRRAASGGPGSQERSPPRLRAARNGDITQWGGARGSAPGSARAPWRPRP